MQPLYLDNHSTTPVDPEVLEAMLPYFSEKFGNPASNGHVYGWEASAVVEEARQTIADSIGASSKDSIIFTSGATESNNLTIKGILNKKPGHIITQETEHRCILGACEWAKKQGHEISVLKVDSNGFVDPADVEKSIKENTVLCSIMAANNEIGTIQPYKDISKICSAHNVLFHSDAVQAVGKIPLNVERDGIDLMSISGHKMYGPKGIGALYISSKSPPIQLSPLFQGGGHEYGIRSGTLNVPGIVGLARAIEISVRTLPKESKRLAKLRNYFLNTIQGKIDGIHLNGDPDKRLPNNINISFDFIKSDELVLATPALAFSTGSACSAGKVEASHVIQALGFDKKRADSAIRLGLGRWTTLKDIDFAVDCLIKSVRKLRSKSLEYEMKG